MEHNDKTTESNSASFEEKVIEVIQNYQKGEGFVHIKITDTPKDANQVVPRKYVTLNGTTANRPTASVIGQRYFDTTIGRPVYWNGSTFVDGAGSIS